ncbi:MAG: IS91 family transposase, partial [Desulfobacteraceae bacterium]|nr:IS91 family transposase [Desulfobacteraceae bacterium]MBC2719296.1 transposase zinc-binding domain-containing protein [Desulfobacteraceae bacterium]
MQDKDVFRNIFVDHWDQFKEEYPTYDKPQYEAPVQKMLGCGKESNGYSEYICINCGRDIRRIGFSCKSCFC